MTFRLPQITGVFLIIMLHFSCTRKHNPPPEKFTEKNENIDLEIREIIFNQLKQYKSDSILILENDTLATASLINMYFSTTDYMPVWTTANTLKPISDSLISMIRSIELFALNSKNYNIDLIVQKLKLANSSNEKSINITRLYEINILLTDIFFRLAIHLKKGTINESTLLPELKLEVKDTSLISFLIYAISQQNIRSTLEMLEPRSEQYRILKLFLKENLKSNSGISHETLKINFLRDEFRSGINEEQKNIQAGDSDLNNTNATEDLYRQINIVMMNMERLRWENDKNDDYFVFINIPSYNFKFFACDTLLIDSKIICGKPETPTPFSLDSKINYFFVYPYWIVPYSIATMEILPILKKDTGYLTKNYMDVLDLKGNILNFHEIKWTKYTEKYFPFTLRQRDGDENTLGVLKFIFPNKYGIYLHDTNAPKLFNKENRALSHGCIRLEKARQLAEAISECCSINFNTDSLNNYVLNKKRKKVDLFLPLPVYIRYYTCVADSGDVNFFDDIYSVDNRMLKSFYTK